ncbi:MAG: hypothetical protein KDK70_04935 [Myxococcales bacterium]|nr:hypothetical protein [Myxococcales bacterium]
MGPAEDPGTWFLVSGSLASLLLCGVGCPGPSPVGPTEDTGTTTEPSTSTTAESTSSESTSAEPSTTGDASCGDGDLDPGEQCDGAQLDGQDCTTLGFDGGELACDEDCSFDASSCTTARCGDGVIEGSESCEGSDLGGQSCASQGYDGGALSCGPTCSYDTSACFDCMVGNVLDFSSPLDVAGWVVTDLAGTGAGWGLYDEAPLNQVAGSMPVPFPNAPVYGTDSNRVPPYPGAQTETSQVVTSPVEIPLQVTFLSWNVDEGSVPFDTKRIDITVDGGASWFSLVDCELAATQPFCAFIGDGRAADDWDYIVLDTSMWAGMIGQLRFSYDTLDGCCNFERGWFIDDLSFCTM